MRQKTIIHVRYSHSGGGTYIARGKCGQVSCTSGEEQAAKRYAEKWYGRKATVSRAPEHDTTSRGNHRGSEVSICRVAYIIN